MADDDAKIRKNAALLIGELRAQEDAQALYRAYEVEKTRFVRSSYLTALKALDVSDYIDSLRERYEELLAYEPQEEERKHVTEERGLLQQLLAQSGVLKKHTFMGWKRRNDVIFTTERALREPLKKQLEASGVRILGAILNKVKMENSHYGRYYGKYYGKYYGSYYGNYYKKSDEE